MDKYQAIHRGDIWLADLPESVGSEENGTRPVVILQNDTGNKHSGTVIAAALTTQIKKEYIPTHVILKAGVCAGSMLMAEQIFTVSKKRLIHFSGSLDQDTMAKVDQAVRVSLGLVEATPKRTLMCLCGRCRQNVFSAPNVRLRRVNPMQIEMDLCTFCGQNRGYDYWVTTHEN